MITGTCMNLSLGLFRKGYNMPGLEPDLRWAWLTLTLSLLVAVGYVAIAFNWYFQNKVAGRHATRAAVRRLSSIVLCCAAFGLWFFVTDMSWPAWRVYDLVLMVYADDVVDQHAFELNPYRATVRRFWSTEPDDAGQVLPVDGHWAMHCNGTAERRLDLDGRPIRLGQQISVVEPDGAILPFRVASIR